jgi:hypothetical protein
MVKHIVSFKFKGDKEIRLQYARKFKEALEALPSQIDVLKSMEVGINENPSETWDLVLSAIVPTMSDVDIYAKHPAHVAAASIIGPVKDSRACVDYEIAE